MFCETKLDELESIANMQLLDNLHCVRTEFGCIVDPMRCTKGEKRLWSCLWYNEAPLGKELLGVLIVKVKMAFGHAHSGSKGLGFERQYTDVH